MTAKQKSNRPHSSGTVVVRDLFDRTIHGELKEFLKYDLEFIPRAVDNDQFNRKYYHNLPFFVDVHAQLAEFASELFGEKVKPSYSFLSMYFDGGQCPLHIDRPQCRYTIDYLIDQTGDEPWPIDIAEPMSDEDRQYCSEMNIGHPSHPDQIEQVIKSNKWTRVLLKPNDAVMYSGTHSWHYRPTKSNGEASLVFFHFVPEDFDGPLA